MYVNKQMILNIQNVKNSSTAPQCSVFLWSAPEYYKNSWYQISKCKQAADFGCYKCKTSDLKFPKQKKPAE